MTTLACTGHVLLDLPIFMGPVVMLVGWVVYVARRDRRTPDIRRRADLTPANPIPADQ